MPTRGLRRGGWRVCAAVMLCVALPACSLFDTTLLDQQRAEIERLREEGRRLLEETEALRQQQARQQQLAEACNRAFGDFDAGRNAPNPADAVAHYRAGLALCPSDDVAHYELGEVYMRLGRQAEARAAFEAALAINPRFTRAQRRLDGVGGTRPPATAPTPAPTLPPSS